MGNAHVMYCGNNAFCLFFSFPSTPFATHPDHSLALLEVHRSLTVICLNGVDFSFVLTPIERLMLLFYMRPSPCLCMILKKVLLHLSDVPACSPLCCSPFLS